MGYVDRNLLNNEQGSDWVHLSRIEFAFHIFLFLVSAALFYPDGAVAVVGNVLAVAALAYLVTSFIDYKTSKFVVTSRRVVLKVGLIRRVSMEMVLNKAESIILDQTIVGRVFNFGSIAVVGTGGTKDPFHRISAPLQFRRAVQEQLAG